MSHYVAHTHFQESDVPPSRWVSGSESDSDSGRLAVETWQAGIDFVNLKDVKL